MYRSRNHKNCCQKLSVAHAAGYFREIYRVKRGSFCLLLPVEFRVALNADASAQ